MMTMYRILLKTALTFAVLMSLSGGPAPAGADAVDLSGMDLLENGLDVRLMPDAGTPLVAALVLVRSGYASERPSQSGFSHLLEHLVFAGTSRRSKFEIQRQVEDLGGYINGFTRDDYTGYIVVGHRDYLAGLLDVLGDILFHSTIPEEGVAEAKAVVLEEIRRDLSRPDRPEEEKFQALLYEDSPYARTGLGNEATVSAATREEIETFYHRAYRPDNMILLLRGGFERAAARQAIKEAFGSAARGGERTVAPPGPPALQAERTYRIDSRMPEIGVQIGYTGPDPKSADASALELMAGILGGPDGMLDRALRSAGLKPRSTSAYLRVNKGFSRLVLSATLPAGADPAAVRRIMIDTVPVILEQKDFPEIMNSAREAMVAAEILGREKLHYFLMGKAPWILSGSPGQGLSPGRWDPLEARDLEGAARKYLVDRPSVTLFTVPAADTAARSPSPGEVRAEAMLDNGLHVIAEERPDSDVFALHLMTRHRSGVEPDGLAGIADFLHRLLPMGTSSRTREEIDSELRSLGVNLSTAGNPMVPFGDFYTSRTFSYIRLEAVADKASQAVAVLADMVLNPLFGDEAIEDVRGEMLDLLTYRESVPGTLAARMLAEKLYAGVLSPDVYGSEQSIKAVTRQDLVEFHRRYLTGRNIIITVVSGMEPEDSIRLVKKAFGDLPAGQTPVVAPVPLTTEPLVLSKELGKPQGALAAGAVTGDIEEADIPALAVASGLLGTRFYEELREKEGLAYSVGVSLGEVGSRVVFTLSMGTAPDKIDRARKAVREQIEAARWAEVTTEEMTREINGLVGRLQMRMLSSINRAYYLGVAARKGLGHSFGEDYRKLLMSLTPEDVARVTRRYLPGWGLVEVLIR